MHTGTDCYHGVGPFGWVCFILTLGAIGDKENLPGEVAEHPAQGDSVGGYKSILRRAFHLEASCWRFFTKAFEGGRWFDVASW